MTEQIKAPYRLAKCSSFIIFFAMTNHQYWLLLKLLPYTLISFVSAIVYWTLEVGLLGTDATYPFSENVYNPGNSFIGVTTMAITLGTGVGIIEETLFKTKFCWLHFKEAMKRRAN